MRENTTKDICYFCKQETWVYPGIEGKKKCAMCWIKEDDE